MNFEVGDELICDCGSEDCKPFVVTRVECWDDGSIAIQGEDCLYILPFDNKLRKLTKLEKALK